MCLKQSKLIMSGRQRCWQLVEVAAATALVASDGRVWKINSNRKTSLSLANIIRYPVVQQSSQSISPVIPIMNICHMYTFISFNFLSSLVFFFPFFNLKSPVAFYVPKLQSFLQSFSFISLILESSLHSSEISPIRIALWAKWIGDLKM